MHYTKKINKAAIFVFECNNGGFEFSFTVDIDPSYIQSLIDLLIKVIALAQSNQKDRVAFSVDNWPIT